MSNGVKAVVLTSTFLRHQYVANILASQVDVVGVWQEEKSFDPMRYAGSTDDEKVIAAHFAARDQSEQDYFGEHAALQLAPGAVSCRVGPGGVNDPAACREMASLQPDVLLVFGTGILKGPILDAFAGRILNIHLGLSPYYRGSGTNFWPLVNGEPEFVGATIHWLDPGIDTGAIAAHVRPEIRRTDGPHDLGNRTIQAAARTLAAAARLHVERGIRSVPQSGRGRLYQRKDFCAEAVRTLYANFESGMLDDYLSHREERDAKLSLVSLEEARD